MHRLTKTNSLQLHFLTLLLHDNFYKWACIMQNEWGMEGMVGQKSNCKLTEEKNLKETYSDWEFLSGIRPEKTIERAVANKNRYGQSMSRTKVWTEIVQTPIKGASYNGSKE